MSFKTALGLSLAVSFAVAIVAARDKAAVPASSPLHVKLGLWQMMYSAERNGMPVIRPVPPELLARMSPEQRAQAEARTRARAAQAGHGQTHLYCLTPERLQKAAFDSDLAQSCQRTFLVSNAKLQKFHDACLEGSKLSEEDGQFESEDENVLRGAIIIKKDGGQMNIEIAGKWIGADCGSDPR